ncbi:hypothetical protein HYV50_01150 [Candidatus Pacearchaeota archaeon]|nr:hypothetical protein [Candidatus Pacearchaeota archaeon]
MEKTFVGVRDVDMETFRKFRARAIEKRVRLGEALTRAMREFLEEEKEKNKEDVGNPRNLLRIKPIRVGKKKVRWSMEIDKFLYGLEK